MRQGEVLNEDNYNLVDGLFDAFFYAPFSVHFARIRTYTVGIVTHPNSEGRFARIQYAGGELALLGTDKGFSFVSLEGDFDEPADDATG